MTLRQFMTTTVEISDQDLRPALALALKTEVPRSRHSYARFYCRVVEELGLLLAGDCDGIDHKYIALGFSWTLDCEKVLAGGVSR